MPAVSIIIPTHNQVGLLREALASVRGQTFHDYEIIVVDDASTDETPGYLETQADVHTICTSATRGPSAARNQGLRAAQGRYIAFLDGDDLFLPGKLSGQVPILESDPPLSMVYSDIQFCDADGRGLPWLYSDIYPPHAGPDIFEALSYGNFIPVHASLIRRACLEAFNGVFDETMRWAEDWHLWLRLAAAYPVCHQPGVVGQYRMHKGSTSQRRLNMTYGNAVVRQWLIASPLFARLALQARYACYLSAAVSLIKLGQTDEARRLLTQARVLRPLHPATHLLNILSRLGAERFGALTDAMRNSQAWIKRTPQPFGRQYSLVPEP